MGGPAGASYRVLKLCHSRSSSSKRTTRHRAEERQQVLAPDMSLQAGPLIDHEAAKLALELAVLHLQYHEIILNRRDQSQTQE